MNFNFYAFMSKADALYTVDAFSGALKKTDYHIHTVYSDGKDTMEECVRAAINKGLCAIAFTDHIWRTSDWVDAYIKESHRLKDRYPELDIYIGAEAKAVNRQGDVDISQKDAEKLDFVIGSVHRRLPDEPDDRYRDLRALCPEAAAEAETETIIAMTKHPNVDVIGHPMRFYYKFFFDAGKTQMPFPETLLRKILSAVQRSGKKIELNFNVPERNAVIDLYRQSGAAFLLGSDAHEAQVIGHIPFEEIARQCQQAR